MYLIDKEHKKETTRALHHLGLPFPLGLEASQGIQPLSPAGSHRMPGALAQLDQLHRKEQSIYFLFHCKPNKQRKSNVSKGSI